MDGAIKADRVLTMRMSTEVELWARNFMETHALMECHHTPGN